MRQPPLNSQERANRQKNPRPRFPSGDGTPEGSDPAGHPRSFRSCAYPDSVDGSKMPESGQGRKTDCQPHETS